MKRKAVHKQRDPGAIADETRARVERQLAKLSFAPEQPAFLERIREFARLLAIWGKRTSLTAKPDDPSEIAFHVLDSLMPLVMSRRPNGAFLLDALAAPSGKVLDLGSGAGFPGLLIAAASPAQFTLCESRRKRASFLSVASAAMNLTNVTIESRRITLGDFAPAFDAVTARAVGDLPAFYRLAASALSKDGIAVLFASPAQDLKTKAAESAGLGSFHRLSYELERDSDRVARLLAVWRKT